MTTHMQKVHKTPKRQDQKRNYHHMLQLNIKKDSKEK